MFRQWGSHYTAHALVGAIGKTEKGAWVKLEWHMEEMIFTLRVFGARRALTHELWYTDNALLARSRRLAWFIRRWKRDDETDGRAFFFHLVHLCDWWILLGIQRGWAEERRRLVTREIRIMMWSRRKRKKMNARWDMRDWTVLKRWL